MNLRTRWQATHYSCPQGTGSHMLPHPTERNINPFLFRAGLRAVQKLVLTLTIHDKNVTMAKTARASITVQTGLASPLEERLGSKAYRNDELRISALSKWRLIIAVSAHMRLPFPIKVQVRSSRHVSFSTPWLNSGV